MILHGERERAEEVRSVACGVSDFKSAYKPPVVLVEVQRLKHSLSFCISTGTRVSVDASGPQTTPSRKGLSGFHL